VNWLARKTILAKAARTSCTGDPRRSTLSSSQGETRFVVSGSSSKRWKFRRIPCPSRGSAEFWCDENADFRIRPEACEIHPALLQAGNSKLVRTLGLDQGLQPCVGGAGSGNVLLPIVSMVKCWGSEQWPCGEIRLASWPW
jgi:hypothetical protein